MTNPLETKANISAQTIEDGSADIFNAHTVISLQSEQLSESMGERARAKAEALPVSNWDRYELLELLGEGGMGRVYRAKDLRLQRIVALKFIRGDDPEMLQRFLYEAQAQARIEHENICKIYEVGEVAGQPYIAMQIIDGPSLKDAAREMTLEEKVMAIRDVAQGLNAAHRIGIIHRDIKPANIMLERSEQGRWRPYVMDFGLARDVQAQGQTVTGVIMGTPVYMPPEQAAGEIRKLDRRSDIYSLGATLYELLCGKPLYEGTNVLSILLKVVKEEPVPLRVRDRNIPSDLETVVLKCLEKEQHLRYDSAKELADDLQRYLDGDPISAQRASIIYVLGKKARKHRAIVAMAAAVLVLMIALTAVAIHSRITAAERARLAQGFAEKAKAIEGIARYAKMLPLHNTQREKVIIKAQMQEIEAEMRQLGEIALGPGHYALGRGYTSLGNLSEARNHLEQAWQSGYQTPDAAFSLGEVMTGLYLEEYQSAKKISDKAAREKRLQEVDEQFRQPSLRYLELAAGSAQSPAYIEMLHALVEGHYENVISKGARALEQSPWLYDAHKYMGIAYWQMGLQRSERGEIEAAMQEFERARAAYRTGSDMARSHSYIYAMEAQLNYSIMTIKTYMINQPADENAQQALAACERAITADPEDGENYIVKANIHSFMGIIQNMKGAAPTELDKVPALVEQALKYEPDSVSAYDVLGEAMVNRARYEMAMGKDPTGSFDQAIAAFHKCVAINPNYHTAYFFLGITYWTKALYGFGLGWELRELLDQSIANLEKSLEHNSSPFSSIISLGNTYEVRGEFEASRGVDPQPWLERAVKYYEQAAALNPKYQFSNANLGIVNKSRGKYEMAVGADPRAFLDRSAEYFNKALTTFKTAEIYRWLGETYVHKSRYELEHGLDCRESLQLAQEALSNGLKINPNDFENYLRQAQAALIAARAGQDRQANFARAERLIARAQELNSRNAEVYFTAAELNYWRAQQTIALAQVEKALSINPNMREAVLLKERITTETRR